MLEMFIYTKHQESPLGNRVGAIDCLKNGETGRLFLKK